MSLFQIHNQSPQYCLSPRWLFGPLAACAVMWWLGSPLQAKDTAPVGDSVDFNRDIRSLLSNKCLICHGPDEEERAAGLRLDTQEGAHEDLGGYAAIMPGEPDESELLLRITSDDEDTLMPPPDKGNPLSKDEVDLVRRWIEQGGDYAQHWSYQKPVQHKLPVVGRTDWPKNAIDHFVLAKLEAASRQPSPQADRLAIARRVALDLTGLPPTWEEAKAFADSASENAYEYYVDRQLAKNSYGERWGRVWLDLARYADSAGYADDPPRTIWAFRDYVVRSLNENKPFDQFTIEQIAGDLLNDPTEEQLIATAFHRNTLTNNEGGTNNEEFRNVAVADRVNTTMAVWMGTTMACAQCHTHKYDPITHEDYFRFYAFFNNTQDTDQQDERPTIEIWSAEQEHEKQQLGEQIASINTELNQPSQVLDADRKRWLTQVSTPPTWTTAKPNAVHSNHREFSIGEDGQITAQGDRPKTDTYRVAINVASGPLAAIQISVPSEQTENFVVSQVQASWSPTDDADKNVPARFVRIELPGKGKHLHLAEIQTFSGSENVALAGTAKQSATGFGGEASRINDGNTDGDFKKGSVTHTDSKKDPWIEIDLGKPLPLDRIVVWNRTDGGDAIAKRLDGYRLQLLDADRHVVWEETPTGVPSPSQPFAFTGRRDIPFVTAIADFSQDGFPANSVVQSKVDKKKGWAVAPRTAKPHQLTLLAAEPVQLGEGTLTIRIQHESNHLNHLLDHFSVRTTDSSTTAAWAKMPANVRQILTVAQENWTEKQQDIVVDYHRSVSPILKKQRAELIRVETRLAKMKAHTTVPIMRDLASDKQRTTKIQIRGNYLSTGDTVTEGTPAAFHPLPVSLPLNRLAMAKWLVDEDNPLTARVIANRHWEQIFGIGIVATSEEFGSQGELPSHPKLLDWLAVELRDSGWDIKRMLKLIVMSATYRQSSVSSDEIIAADPFNRMLSRGPRFRISAEMVRDQALFASGLLSEKLYGKPVNPPQPELGLKAAFGSATDWKTSLGDDRYRRGIYTNWRRSSPYPSMAQFDAPNREVCTVRRIRTNTPLQALVTLNDPVFVEAAQALARRMIAASGSYAERIQFGIRSSLIRHATDAEIERLTKLANDAQKHFSADPEKAEQMATDPLGKLPDGADAAQEMALYAAWTVVGNVILNLDEIFMKR